MVLIFCAILFFTVCTLCDYVCTLCDYVCDYVVIFLLIICSYIFLLLFDHLRKFEHIFLITCANLYTEVKRDILGCGEDCSPHQCWIKGGSRVRVFSGGPFFDDISYLVTCANFILSNF